MTMRSPVRFLLKLCVSAGLLWFVAQTVDLAGLRSRLADLAPGMAALAVTVFFLQLWIAAMRWHEIARVVGVHLPLRALWSHLLMAQCCSQVLPSSIGGDAIRTWLVQRNRVPLRPAFLSVLLDRLVGTQSLVLVAVVALCVPSSAEVEGAVRIAVWTIAAGTAAGLVIMLTAARLPGAWFASFRLLRIVHAAATGMSGICLHPRACFAVTASSLLVHMLSIAGIWLLACALGIDLDALTLAAIVPVALLASSVPISIGGWGVREGVLVHLLNAQGIPAGSALALSLSFGMALALASLPGGLLWLMTRPRLPTAMEAVGSEYQAL